MEAYVANDRHDRKELIGRHLILLANNPEGWANLRILRSKAFTERFYYHPRIDKQLLEDHAKGLIGMTACLAGEVPRHIRYGEMDAARATAREHRSNFDTDLHLPVDLAEVPRESSQFRLVPCSTRSRGLLWTARGRWRGCAGDPTWAPVDRFSRRALGRIEEERKRARANGPE